MKKRKRSSYEKKKREWKEKISIKGRNVSVQLKKYISIHLTKTKGFFSHTNHNRRIHQKRTHTKYNDSNKRHPIFILILPYVQILPSVKLTTMYSSIQQPYLARHQRYQPPRIAWKEAAPQQLWNSWETKGINLSILSYIVKVVDQMKWIWEFFRCLGNQLDGR